MTNGIMLESGLDRKCLFMKYDNPVCELGINIIHFCCSWT